MEIITYVKTLEAAVYFQSPVPKSEVNYHSRIKQPMDLSTIFQRAQKGMYDEPDDNDQETTTLVSSSSSSKKSNQPRGITGLWDDLRLIIKNAKVFNQPERAEWRTADMLEYEVRRIKHAYKYYTMGDTNKLLKNTPSLASTTLSSSSSSSFNPMMNDDWDIINELEDD